MADVFDSSAGATAAAVSEVARGDANGGALPKDRPFQPSMPGVLLLNGKLDPIYLNLEVVKILGYPDAARASDVPNGFLGERIRTVFGSVGPASGPSFPTELISGRRRYICRKLSVNAVLPSSESALVAVLLERNNPRSFDGSRVAAQFRLSQRERETMELLVRGFTSKEIAHRMRISPNTVKAFLRLIMVKMNVTTRSGLVARVFDSVAEASYLFRQA